MNQESIDQMTRHVDDAHRVETYFAGLTDEEVDRVVNEKQTNISIRWTLCRRSFQMLFMALNRGNKFPSDSFEIRLKQEQIGDDTVETLARVWRNRQDNSFNVRPFVRNGRIVSREFPTEQFSDAFTYRHGTYRSKLATLTIDHDEPDPLIKLLRVEGKLFERTRQTDAVFMAAIDNIVTPQIDATEETLILISEAARDPELNPEHALKYRINH